VEAGSIAAGSVRARLRRAAIPLLIGLLGAVAAWRGLQPHWWRSAAENAMADGRFDEARALLVRLVARRPHDAESRLKLAQLLDLAGDTAAAATHLAGLPPAVQGREDVLINWGRMLLSLDRPSEAETVLQRCAREYPETTRARQYLLDLLRWQHRDEEGQAVRMQLVELARRKSPDDRLWILFRSFIEEYSKIEDQENWQHLLRCWNRDREDVHVRIAMARHLILQGDRVQEAAADLEALLPHSPDNPAAIAALLEYYLNVEGRSVTRAQELLARWPAELRFHTYWRYLGQMREQQSDEREALTAYRRALDVRPDDRPALQRLSALLTRIGRRDGNEQQVAEGTALAERLTRVGQLLSASEGLLKRGLQSFEGRRGPVLGKTQLADAALLRDLADFYRALGRQAECDAWLDLAAELESA
jgi:predicted Zn-dependent protease